MQYETQKAACEEYAQQNGYSVADVIRVSGRKGAVVLSKDGRTIFDPFVIEPIAEVITAKPTEELKKEIKERVDEEVKPKIQDPAPKRKTPVRKKK